MTEITNLSSKALILKSIGKYLEDDGYIVSYCVSAAYDEYSDPLDPIHLQITLGARSLMIGLTNDIKYLTVHNSKYYYSYFDIELCNPKMIDILLQHLTSLKMKQNIKRKYFSFLKNRT